MFSLTTYKYAKSKLLLYSNTSTKSVIYCESFSYYAKNSFYKFKRNKDHSYVGPSSIMYSSAIITHNIICHIRWSICGKKYRFDGPCDYYNYGYDYDCE